MSIAEAEVELAKAKFESKIKRQRSGCWIWKMAKNKDGYGVTDYKGKTVTAHRLSYVLYKGDIPDGMCVLHKCDNPSCVNPGCLWLGTISDNAVDMHKKGRGAGHTGCHHSVETKELLRRLATGNKHCLGKKKSEEHKKKLSLASKGNKNRLGQMASDETKAKMREAKIGKKQSPEHIAKRVASKKYSEGQRRLEQKKLDMKMPEETKKKISVSMKKYRAKLKQVK